MGRFRNLIQTTVVPSKRMKFENSIGLQTSTTNTSSHTSTSDNMSKHLHSSAYIPHLYHDLPPSADHDKMGTGTMSHFTTDLDMSNMSSKFGLILPNPAPEVAPTNEYNLLDDIGSGTSVSSLSAGGSYGTSPTKSIYIITNTIVGFFFNGSNYRYIGNIKRWRKYGW